MEDFETSGGEDFDNSSDSEFDDDSVRNENDNDNSTSSRWPGLRQPFLLYQLL